MEIIQLTDVAKAAARAAEILRRGGIILYPTDTLYGLGADALSDAPVDAVYAIKGREPGKPTHCIVSDLAMASEYAEVNDAARKLADAFLPGPLTLILKKKEGVAAGIGRGMDTMGFRIPASAFCMELARAFGGPITTPSANLAGAEPQLSIDAILAQFGETASHIDLVIDAGSVTQTKPSTVVNVASGTPVILREGATPASDIFALF